jgi:DNA-binding NarL/FixJ family response regulator
MASSRSSTSRSAHELAGASSELIAVALAGERGTAFEESLRSLQSDSGLQLIEPACGAALVTVLVSYRRGAALTALVARTRRAGAPLVLVLPRSAARRDLRRAMLAGADGIALAGDPTLPATVHAVACGQLAVPQLLLRRVAAEPLSHREKQILDLVAAGATNRQIADEMYLAESTVKAHVSSIFGKLGANSRAELAQIALDPEEGLAEQLRVVRAGELAAV